MYKGYQIKESDLEKLLQKDAATNLIYGYDLFNKYNELTESSFESFLPHNRILRAEDLEKDWFPKINADVFITHSHYDEERAIMLAGWLNKNFMIRSFIDSQLWGFIYNLLHNIDDRIVCKSKEEYYEARNRTTSLVYSILYNAIQQMIDKTECFIFLYSSNSVDQIDISPRTTSPWIYAELETSKVIRKHLKRRIYFSGNKQLNENYVPSISFPVDNRHLYKLNAKILKLWKQFSREKELTKEQALDVLYAKSKEKS